MSTDAFSQLLGREQAIRFNHRLLGVDPAFSSMGLSQGLWVGKKKGKMRTPLPVCLTCWLCSRSQLRTILLTWKAGIIPDQEPVALADAAARRSQPYSRNAMVIALTGRPVTKRTQICERSGSSGGPFCHKTP